MDLDLNISGIASPSPGGAEIPVKVLILGSGPAGFSAALYALALFQPVRPLPLLHGRLRVHSGGSTSPSSRTGTVEVTYVAQGILSDSGGVVRTVVVTINSRKGISNREGGFYRRLFPQF